MHDCRSKVKAKSSVHSGVQDAMRLIEAGSTPGSRGVGQSKALKCRSIGHVSCSLTCRAMVSELDGWESVGKRIEADAWIRAA